MNTNQLSSFTNKSLSHFHFRQYPNHWTKGFLAHNCYLVDIIFSIITIVLIKLSHAFALVTTVEILWHVHNWLGLIIVVKERAACLLTKFGKYAHKTLVEWTWVCNNTSVTTWRNINAFDKSGKSNQQHFPVILATVILIQYLLHDHCRRKYLTYNLFHP